MKRAANVREMNEVDEVGLNILHYVLAVNPQASEEK